MTRVVFDTSVLISAFLFRRSVPRLALDVAAEHATILMSDGTREELEEVLWRPKFDRYVTAGTRSEFLEYLLLPSERVEITHHLRVCRDPKDDKFLEVAVNGRATCLVTGDDDLLVLHPFRGVDILTARDFLERRTT